MLNIPNKGVMKSIATLLALVLSAPLVAGDTYEYDLNGATFVAPEPAGMRALYGVNPEMNALLESLYPAQGQIFEGYLSFDANQEPTGDHALIGTMPVRGATVDDARKTARQSIAMMEDISPEKLQEAAAENSRRVNEAAGTEGQIEHLGNWFVEDSLTDYELGSSFATLVESRVTNAGESETVIEFRRIALLVFEERLLMALYVETLDNRQAYAKANTASLAWFDKVVAMNTDSGE
ncbi:MAG: hypothetical protein R3217_08960 [Gammaproteobacteria bacterium]|nr:hypothetical protein [Gammaproteobacteria bacterium]